MTRNKIFAIVEGHGEANRPKKGSQPAVVELIVRMLQHLQCWSLLPPPNKVPPFRMSYGEFFRDDKLERVLRHYKSFDDCAAVLILLDMDDDCPTEKAAVLTDRIRQMEALPFSVVVVCAKCEYEAWFLASLETIQGAAYSGEPEALRGAKEWLRKQFGYKPTHDQAEYTRLLDIPLARERSRSFRRLYHAFEEIIAAQDKQIKIITPDLNLTFREI